MRSKTLRIMRTKYIMGGFFSSAILFVGRKPKDLNHAFMYSIAKWLKVYEYLVTLHKAPNDGGTTTCGFCHLFHANYTGERYTCCNGCPIAEHTGSKYCLNTPYEGYSECHDKEHSIRVCLKEIDFLFDVAYNDANKISGVTIWDAKQAYRFIMKKYKQEET